MGCTGSKKQALEVKATTASAPAALDLSPSAKAEALEDYEMHSPKTLLQGLSRSPARKEPSDLFAGTSAEDAVNTTRDCVVTEVEGRDEETLSSIPHHEISILRAADAAESPLAAAASPGASPEGNSNLDTSTRGAKVIQLPVKWIEVEEMPEAKAKTDACREASPLESSGVGCDIEQLPSKSKWMCLTYCKQREEQDELTDDTVIS